MIQLQEKKQEKEHMTTWLLREHRKAEEKKIIHQSHKTL